MSVLTLVRDPDRFFEHASDSESLTGPFAMVTLAAVTSVLSTAVVFFRFAEALSSVEKNVISFSLIIGSVMGFLMVYLGWLVVSVLLYVLVTRVFKSESSGFRPMFRMAGWAFLPSIPSGLLSAWTSYIVYYGREIPSDPQQLGSLTSSLSSHPLFMVSRAGAVMFTLWQGFLWLFVVKHTTELDTRRAGIVALVPSGLIIAVQILG